MNILVDLVIVLIIYILIKLAFKKLSLSHWRVEAIFSGLFLCLFYSSKSFETLSNIFLAILFSLFCLNSNDRPSLKLNDFEKKFLKYCSLQFIIQWVFAISCILFIHKIFPEVERFFGIVLPISFVGGHGSAIVVSKYISNEGYNHYRNLMLMSATIGVCLSLFFGLIQIIKNQNRIKDKCTVNIFPRIDMSLSIVLFIVIIALIFKTFVLNIPLFIITIILSLAIRLKFHFSTNQYSTITTDLLVLTSIASIEFFDVSKYLFPLIFIWLVGLSLGLLNFYAISPKLFKNNLKEYSLFTWGWSVGGVAIGLSLVQSIDPKNRAKAFENYAKIYPFLFPIELGLLTIIPFILVRYFH